MQSHQRHKSLSRVQDLDLLMFLRVLSLSCVSLFFGDSGRLVAIRNGPQPCQDVQSLCDVDSNRTSPKQTKVAGVGLPAKYVSSCPPHYLEHFVFHVRRIRPCPDRRGCQRFDQEDF